MSRNGLKSKKISRNFSYISKFQKIVLSCDKILPEGNFERQFETLNALKKLSIQRNFAKFNGNLRIKYKALSLSKTKDFQKDNLQQAVAVLQSLREIQYSVETIVFSFTALSHYFFSKSQLALNGKFLDLIGYLKCTFIHLLTRLYLMPFQKTSRARGNNRTDRQYI